MKRLLARQWGVRFLWCAVFFLITYPLTVYFYFGYEREGLSVAAWNGQFHVMVTRNQLYIDGRRPYQKGWDVHRSDHAKWNLTPKLSIGPVGFQIGMPQWIAILIFGSLAIGCSWRRWSYAKRGCKQCGYDLTGNVSGVCPECGVPLDD